MTVLGLLFITLLTSCVATPPTNLYMISGLSNDVQSATRAKSKVMVGVGPVSLPAYLNRPQIVTRTSPNKLAVAEFDRWAEPLEKLIQRVLSENLSVLLNSDTVFTLPRRRLSEVDIQVEVEVFRFDTAPDGVVELTARWSVYTRGGKKLAAAKKSTIRERAAVQADYETIVITMSRVMERLSQEIAAALRPLT